MLFHGTIPIMNKKVLHTLEFDKVIEKLMGHATSDKGRDYARMLKPTADLDKIRDRQRETADALSRIFREGSISFSGIHDPGIFGKRLEIGSSLNAGELLSIVSLLAVASRAKKYGSPARSDTPGDSLSHYFTDLDPLDSLRHLIDHCIISEDQIADDASSGLKNCRRQMASMNDRIRSQMTSLLNSASVRDCLQDTVITMRDGRYCLPVKADCKSQVPGMVHDQSGSGSTLFIEPMSVVNMNNELRELELTEQKEIEKVLADLSAQVYEVISIIISDFKILAELDFIFAKGQLAQEMNAMEPVLNTKGCIHLKKARHPLLDPKKVVPIDIRLGEDFDLLVVTGPNTGGKTVSLKTVGLLTLMAQAGLHIPAADRSQVAVFQDVYADIGDEQSIEQSLSTFSSHMTNIVSILKQVHSPAKAERTALVLFDELCAGTDPSEGAALATSILDRLHKTGIRTMATTHYPELKVYALTTPGVENACCEFSLETLSPTYRLLIGIPGKSNAFAISKKLGLSEDLIAEAQGRLDENDQSFEDLMVSLEERKIALERDKEKAERERAKAETFRRQAESQKDNLNDRRDAIIAKANEEAAQILARAKEKADTVIRNFNKYGTGTPDMAEMERQRSAIGEELKDARSKAAVKAKNTSKRQAAGGNVDSKKLRIGDDVMVLSMNVKGTVHTLPDAKGNLTVQMGIMQTKVNLRDIAVIGDAKPTNKYLKKKATVHKGSLNKSRTMSTELMLLGMTADEAVAAVDKFIDDARLTHLEEVRIVHGKGSGILRKAVHDYLRRQKDIRGYHLGAYGEGDSGVTIVEL